MASLIELLEQLFEQRLVNPARITAVGVEREHLADMATLQAQAEHDFNTIHGRGSLNDNNP